jgi:hypothetical protein
MIEQTLPHITIYILLRHNKLANWAWWKACLCFRGLSNGQIVGTFLYSIRWTFCICCNMNISSNILRFWGNIWAYFSLSYYLWFVCSESLEKRIQPKMFLLPAPKFSLVIDGFQGDWTARSWWLAMRGLVIWPQLI